jgi:DNA-binding response OmpR family regulator
MILDITLPGFNGLEVCNVLRSDDNTKNIKIIAISRDLRYTETEVLGAGANSFLTKLDNFETLLFLCNEFLEEPETLK